MKTLHKQKGFSILAVLLTVAVVIVALSVWVVSGQSNAATNDNSKADVQASALLNDAANIRVTYKQLIANGADPNNIVFIPNTASTDSNPNILDPTNGLPLPKVNQQIVKDGATSFWLYNSNAGVTNLNTGSDLTRVVYVFNIKDNVCKRINYMINGQNSIITTGIPVINFYNGADPTNPMMGGTPTFGGTQPYRNACFGNSGQKDTNIFYSVINY